LNASCRITDKIGQAKMKIRNTLLSAAFITLMAALVSTGDNKDVPCQVQITTAPEGATIYINESPVGTSPCTVPLVPPITVLIKAEKRNYENTTHTLSIAENEQLRPVDLQLTPVLGLVLIHTVPENVNVEIDGLSKGATPLLLTDLPVGQHRVKLSALGFQTKEIKLSIENRIPVGINETLISDSGSINLDSEPSGAKVLLNGVDKGTTPCVISASKGENTLELIMEGYEPYKRSFRVKAGTIEDIKPVLKAIPSNLTIRSIPDGARVYIENQYRGVTPLELKKIEPGSYRIRVEKNGYAPDARTIDLKNGKDHVEEFRMSIISGTLAITTKPFGVTVLIDGKEAGETKSGEGEISQVFIVENLSAGNHTLLLTTKGYAALKKNVTIEERETLSIQLELTKLFIPDYFVRTSSGTYEGVLVKIDSRTGNIKLEIAPGVIREFERDKIVKAGPLEPTE